MCKRTMWFLTGTFRLNSLRIKLKSNFRSNSGSWLFVTLVGYWKSIAQKIELVALILMVSLLFWWSVYNKHTRSTKSISNFSFWFQNLKKKPTRRYSHILFQNMRISPKYEIFCGRVQYTRKFTHSFYGSDTRRNLFF